MAEKTNKLEEIKKCNAEFCEVLKERIVIDRESRKKK